MQTLLFVKEVKVFAMLEVFLTSLFARVPQAIRDVSIRQDEIIPDWEA